MTHCALFKLPSPFSQYWRDSTRCSPTLGGLPASVGSKLRSAGAWLGGGELAHRPRSTGGRGEFTGPWDKVSVTAWRRFNAGWENWRWEAILAATTGGHCYLAREELRGAEPAPAGDRSRGAASSVPVPGHRSDMGTASKDADGELRSPGKERTNEAARLSPNVTTSDGGSGTHRSAAVVPALCWPTYL